MILGTMDEAAAQDYHEDQQEIAEKAFESVGHEVGDQHFGGCWCCCWDCGFDFHAVQDGQGAPGQELT